MTQEKNIKSVDIRYLQSQSLVKTVRSSPEQTKSFTNTFNEVQQDHKNTAANKTHNRYIENVKAWIIEKTDIFRMDQDIYSTR